MRICRACWSVVWLAVVVPAPAKNLGPVDPRPKVNPLLLPLPAGADQAPWGEEVDGLSCRLLVEPAVTHGQPIRAVVQVRNNSKRDRYLYNVFDLRLIDHSQLSLQGPDGKDINQNSRAKGGPPVPQQFVLLKAGEIRRIEFVDIRGLFANWLRRGKSMVPVDAFSRDGVYRLGYTYRGPKMPARAVTGQRSTPDGKVENIYTEATREQLDGAWSGTLRAPAVSIELKPLTEKDLTVHEWGVFTVFAGARHANLNRQEEWAGLPADFYRQFPTRRLRWAPAAWDKPIIYFYSQLPAVEIDVQVQFADGGAPVVWWPCAAEPVNDSLGRGGLLPPDSTDKAGYFDALRWTGWLGHTVPHNGYAGDGYLVRVEEFKLPETTWVRQARLPKAAPFTVSGSTLQLSTPWASTRPETERFIYYDGLVPAPDHLQCLKVTDEAVTVKNLATFPLGPLFLVDRRRERSRRDAAWAVRQEPIAPGAEVVIPLQAFQGNVPANLVQAVRQGLLDAGLFAEEADVILKIWHKSFFEGSGLTALRLLPEAEYHRMLPLTIAPKPARTVRVGIAYHPHIEQQPELAARAARLIADLDSAEFPVREAATHALEKLGPWAVPFLDRALKTNPSLETRQRLERILKQADAAAWLREVPKTPAKGQQ